MNRIDHRLLAAGVLTFTCALFMSLIALGNITDYGANKAFVVGVLQMKTTFRDSHVMWRAINDPVLQNGAYMAIIAAELLAAAVLWGALTRLWRIRNAGDVTDAAAWITRGLLVIIAIFGIGFTAIGGEYFEMWQSPTWNGMDAALRYFLFAVAALAYCTTALDQVHRDRAAHPADRPHPTPLDVLP